MPSCLLLECFTLKSDWELWEKVDFSGDKFWLRNRSLNRSNCTCSQPYRLFQGGLNLESKIWRVSLQSEYPEHCALQLQEIYGGCMHYLCIPLCISEPKAGRRCPFLVWGNQMDGVLLVRLLIIYAGTARFMGFGGLCWVVKTNKQWASPPRAGRSPMLTRVSLSFRFFFFFFGQSDNKIPRGPPKLYRTTWYQPGIDVHDSHLIISLSFDREGRWGTTDDFATSFLHFSLFSTALWDLANSRPVHSPILSSHLSQHDMCVQSCSLKTQRAWTVKS